MHAIVVLCFVSVVYSCEKPVWRGQVIHCCKNGTKVQYGKEAMWVNRTPLLCQGENAADPEEQALLATVLWAIFGISSLLCGLHCCCGYVLYKLFWKKEEEA